MTVSITVFRLYSADDAVALAAEPELLVARIRSDRRRSPMAVIECPDVIRATAVVDILSGAFGVVILDLDYEAEPLPPAHPLIDQGKAMLREAKKVVGSNLTSE